MGQAKTLNRGFDMARGELIGYINSDDVFLPGAITKLAALLVTLCTLFAVVPAAALPPCQWPVYENDFRFWGEVFSVYNSGEHVIALELYGYAQPRVFMRIECGDEARSHYLGCDQIALGDSVLLRGNLEDLISDATACPPQPDGVVNFGEARVMFRCQGHVAGTCTQLTACQ